VTYPWLTLGGDFLSGGISYPTKNTHRICPTVFWEGHISNICSLKNQNKFIFQGTKAHLPKNSFKFLSISASFWRSTVGTGSISCTVALAKWSRPSRCSRGLGYSASMKHHIGLPRAPVNPPFTPVDPRGRGGRLINPSGSPADLPNWKVARDREHYYSTKNCNHVEGTVMFCWLFFFLLAIVIRRISNETPFN